MTKHEASVGHTAGTDADTLELLHDDGRWVAIPPDAAGDEQLTRWIAVETDVLCDLETWR